MVVLPTPPLPEPMAITFCTPGSGIGPCCGGPPCTCPTIVSLEKSIIRSLQTRDARRGGLRLPLLPRELIHTLAVVFLLAQLAASTGVLVSLFLFLGFRNDGRHRHAASPAVDGDKR